MQFPSKYTARKTHTHTHTERERERERYFIIVLFTSWLLVMTIIYV